jgi:hypothetical protein
LGGGHDGLAQHDYWSGARIIFMLCNQCLDVILERKFDVCSFRGVDEFSVQSFRYILYGHNLKSSSFGGFVAFSARRIQERNFESSLN